MKSDEKKCPDCAEIIKKEALVCKHCGHRFDPGQVKAEQEQDRKNQLIGCGALLALIIAVPMCIGGSGDPVDPKIAAADAAAERAEKAEERRKGFHCLSAWDGSHPGVVEQVTQLLRDPGSFEHDETRITPVNEKGEHLLTMRYRARNGFGGMNVETAVATVQNQGCGAMLVLNE